VAEDSLPGEARLERAIVARYSVRLHLSLILVACFAAGMIVSKLLLVAGLHSMLLRYPMALVAAYATFLVGIRLWLAYAGYGGGSRPPANARKSTGSGFDIGNAVGANIDLPSFGKSGAGSAGSVFRGGGGGFGGGGASAEFADVAEGAQAPVRTAGFFSGFGGKSSGGGFDLGDDGWVIVALIALVSAVLGAGAYLVYMAPTILSDAAFAALLSGALAHSTRRIASEGWIGSVVRDTWIPFAVVLALTLIFAATAHRYHPEAHTLHELVRSML
jgi:hypothetical protein